GVSVAVPACPTRRSSDRLGVARALALLEQAGRDDGRLLLLTSGLSREEQTAIDDLPPRGVRLDIVGVGSPSGAPILQEDGRATRSEEHTSELQSRENLVC